MQLQPWHHVSNTSATFGVHNHESSLTLKAVLYYLAEMGKQQIAWQFTLKPAQRELSTAYCLLGPSSGTGGHRRALAVQVLVLVCKVLTLPRGFDSWRAHPQTTTCGAHDQPGTMTAPAPAPAHEAWQIRLFQPIIPALQCPASSVDRR